MSEAQLLQLQKLIHAQSKTMGIDHLYSVVEAHFRQHHGRSIKKSTFHNKINPDRTEHKLNIEEFSLLLMALKEQNLHAPILEEFMSLYHMRPEYLHTQSSTKEHNYKSFMGDWMDLNKEHGDVQVALTSALNDYKITEHELNGIKVELSEHIQALTTLRAALDHVAGKTLI
ncbi:hypothetical protein SAMN04488540_10524 [Ferrimonas sediminum]|uniref:Uncharacterized protein n=1 Tax=Ferrimonas sediminum TaxID=718193 RepID=A0A1G8R190_9GAMM|nr:phage regulatory CII family protein [Ferrimonas sediminum]SDJ10711.1 hypothetical protein SAMN04488540_10524 [Ferrimonas sediminum]